MSPIISGGGGGGGASPSTATSTITTDTSTFVGTHVFDLGAGPHVAQVITTITALVGNGETWGTGPGQIQVVIDQPGRYVGSFDNVTFANLTDSVVYEPTMTAVNDFNEWLSHSPRYLRPLVTIVDDTFNTYSGPHTPTASVRFDVVYR